MPFDAFSRVARALYRAAPRDLRRRLGRFAVRSEWAQSLRKRAMDADRDEAGNKLEGDAARELAARRQDFADRFVVASSAAPAISEVGTILAQTGRRAAQVVAFYLPQYHRIPENDAWWGPGFTEWSNVARAIPQFVGHHQPRLPGELGFYDLTTPGVMARQIELAKAYGVSAFCFHYYWFAGRRLLERPLDAFLDDPSLDIRFSLSWANENWTRRWDGTEDELLIAQGHSREDHAAVFADMARYLEDARAIRIDGRPLVTVYRPEIIPKVRTMLEIWREAAQRRGWPGIYIAATDAFLYGEEEAAKAGFDGLVEFPPHGLSPPRIDDSLAWLNPNHRGAVFDYTQVVEEAARRLAKRKRSRGLDHFPGVMPGWDNEARRPGAANVFHGATPQAYGQWLAAACDAAERTLAPGRELVFVNAWNEWAEGAYLEPDRKWGRDYLEQTAAVVRAIGDSLGE